MSRFLKKKKAINEQIHSHITSREKHFIIENTVIKLLEICVSNELKAAKYNPVRMLWLKKK